MSYEKFGETIYFFCNFNDNLDKNILKKLNSVKYIEFVNYTDFYEKQQKFTFSINDRTNKFNKSINDLPSHIKSLILGYSFNQVIKNYPEKLKELIFGHKYNQDVNNLPANLIKLVFGFEFNKPVDNLPNKIKILSFGNSFSQSVDYLPCSITHLEFGQGYSNSLDNLPCTIKFIILNRKNYTILSKIYPKIKIKLKSPNVNNYSLKNYYYDKKINF